MEEAYLPRLKVTVVTTVRTLGGKKRTGGNLLGEHSGQKPNYCTPNQTWTRCHLPLKTLSLINKFHLILCLKSKL